MADEAQQQEQTALAVTQSNYPMREMLTILKDTGDSGLFQAFARDIVEREVAVALFAQDSRLARVFSMSGAFDGIGEGDRGVAMAMTKIQLGRSWNMAPADSMESVFFINGRPSVATKHLAAKMHDAGIAWDIEWLEENDTCTGCRLHLKRWDPATNSYLPIKELVNGVERRAVVSFTKKDADQAQINEKGKTISLSDKWNFKSWPSDMYFARCVSRVRTRYAPNILSGVLTKEEAEDSSPPEIRKSPERAALTAAEFTPSVSENRGHDRVSEKPVVAVAQEKAAAPTAPAEVIVEAVAEPVVEDKQPSPQFPWATRSAMNAMFIAEKNRIGDTAFSQVFAKHNTTGGSLKHDDVKALAVYADLQAAAASGKDLL